MEPTRFNKSEVARRAHEIYDARIRHDVEPAHHGEYLALDIESGEYALGRTSLIALEELRARRPDGTRFLMRIGYPTAISFRGRSRVYQR